jgi:DNA-3-methyladenine glycosylase
VSRGHWTKEHFRGDAQSLAKSLLGAQLVSILDDGRRVSGSIVETEAYLGVMDRAAHAFGGRRTKRNETMYAAAGTAYVYLIYGMYNCFNVVCGEPDEPTAVLVRALAPIEGIERMREARSKAKRERDLCSGPGKLCQALFIDRSLDGVDLTSSDRLFIKGEPGPPTDGTLICAPRIGVDYAGAWANKPLRYYLEESEHVSKKLRP